MDTALLREHCFEAEERSHDYHTSCERRAAGKGTHHVCGPAPGELVDHFCHRAIDLYHRSEEHTSELQSRLHLVCRLLLEKKKKQKIELTTHHIKSSRHNIALALVYLDQH